MELLVNRKTRTAKTTIGELSIDGKFFSYCLEDVDRGLNSTMPLADIMAKKIHSQTAIPTGRYQLSKYFSPKHGGMVPLLLHVPGFDFVEIHAGNYADDTDGCLLLGSGLAQDMVTSSKDTIAKFYPIIFGELNSDRPVWITYQ